MYLLDMGLLCQYLSVASAVFYLWTGSPSSCQQVDTGDLQEVLLLPWRHVTWTPCLMTIVRSSCHTEFQAQTQLSTCSRAIFSSRILNLFYWSMHEWCGLHVGSFHPLLAGEPRWSYPLALWRIIAAPPIAGRIANGLTASQLLPNIALRLHAACRTLPAGAASEASIGTVVYEDWREWSQVGADEQALFSAATSKGAGEHPDWRTSAARRVECRWPLMCFSTALQPGVLAVRHFSVPGNVQSGCFAFGVNLTCSSMTIAVASWAAPDR